MRIHQFVKEDCNCFRRATHWVCKHCGTREYRSKRELTRLNKTQAQCTDPSAPKAPSDAAFKAMLGGTFDCLAPEER